MGSIGDNYSLDMEEIVNVLYFIKWKKKKQIRVPERMHNVKFTGVSVQPNNTWINSIIRNSIYI